MMATIGSQISLDDLDAWRDAGYRVAVARVVDLEGSGPRLPGAAMAVNDEGDVVGSVSGGCVEGAVVIEALDVIETGDRRTVTFGYSDDEAFAVGPISHRRELKRQGFSCALISEQRALAGSLRVCRSLSQLEHVWNRV